MNSPADFDANGYYIPRPLHDARAVFYSDPRWAENQNGPEDSPYVDWCSEWEQPTDIEWLIEPFIPAGRGVALYSDAKAGKSILMLECAAALATGRNVLGVTTEKCAVLYVDFENVLGSDTIARLKRMGYKGTDLRNLHYMSFPDLPALDQEHGGATILARALELNARLVVFDTASRTISGKENDSDTWIQWARATGTKLKAHGIAYVRMDHTGKDADKGQRGSSAKTGDVDAVWQLRASNADRDLLTLKLDIGRYRVTEEEIVLRRADEPLLTHVVQANRGAAHAEAVETAALRIMGELDLWDAGNDTIADELRSRGLRFRQGKITDWKQKAITDRHNR